LVEHASDESESEHERHDEFASAPIKEPVKVKGTSLDAKSESEEDEPKPEPVPEVKPEPEKPKPKPRASKKKTEEHKSDSDEDPKPKKEKKPRASKKKQVHSEDSEPELVKDDYEGELELLEEVDHDDGNIYYIHDQKVYNAEKKCVGKVALNGTKSEIVMF